MVRSAVVVVAAFVTLVAAAGGCEAIVSSGLPPYQCTGTDPSSCPSGSYCSNAACVPCDPGQCAADASVDVGSFDTAVPDTTIADVTIPDVPIPFEGAPGPDAPLDGAGDGDVADVASDAADAVSMGDAATDTVPDAACSGIGCACVGAGDCAGGLCGDGNVLGPTFNGAHGSVCTQTCCTAADCPSGFVCYGPGNAGSYCVSAAAIGRPATQGSMPAGATCIGAGDCRSGVCIGGQCVDLCCGDSDCNGGTTCALDGAGLDGHEVFACLPGQGATAAHAACTTSAQCASADCQSSTCRPGCCSLAACMASGFGACELASAGADSVYSCTFPSTPPTGAAFAQPCTKITDCASRVCDVAAGTCTASCCVDADCATLGTFVCRPAGASPFNLLCTKP